MKHIKLYVLSCLLFTPLLIHGAAYIKFDGVDGESKDKDHKGWIDLTSVSTRGGGHDNWITIESFTRVTRGQSLHTEGVVHRDVADRSREKGTGLATGKRAHATGQPTGKRDAASGLPTGKRQHKPIRVTKSIDKATPMLAQSLNSGNSIGDVTIQRVANGKTETLVLVNATVTDIQKAGTSEHVSFAYESIRQTAKATTRGWDPKSKKAIQGSTERSR